jgi:hypothetical protein
LSHPLFGCSLTTAYIFAYHLEGAAKHISKAVD